MKYIDAEKLKTEIERLKGQLIRGACAAQIEMETNCKDEAYNEVLAIIDSLQQEHPEVDLDFQAFAKEMDAVFNLPKEVTENTEENPLNWEYAIARHFFELSLNARKEENK